MKYLLGISVVLVSTAIQAQENCASLINFSRITSSTAADNSTFDQEAANFCSSYNKGSTTSSDTNFAASYKFIAASYGQENASTETIASKVCSASNRSAAKTDAYKQYVESIAPGAYDAYKACIVAKDSLQFSISSASMLPTDFTVSARFVLLAVGAKAELKQSPSDGITCGWNNSNAQSITLRGGDSAALRCKRSDQTKPGYVTVINSTGQEQITIPWKRYTAAGNPVDTLNTIAADLSKLQTQAVAMGARIDTLDRRAPRLECKVTSTGPTGPLQNAIREVRIPAADQNQGYFVTGGGCGAYEVPSVHSPIITDSRITGDRQGWYCQTRDPANVPNTNHLNVYAIYCKAHAQ